MKTPVEYADAIVSTVPRSLPMCDFNSAMAKDALRTALATTFADAIETARRDERAAIVDAVKADAAKLPRNVATTVVGSVVLAVRAREGEPVGDDRAECGKEER